MNEPAVSDRERPKRDVRGLLLLQMVLATGAGAWGGWLETPYSSFVLLLGMIGCFALLTFAFVRSVSRVLTIPGRRIEQVLPFMLVVGCQPVVYVNIVAAERTLDRWGNEARFDRNRVRYEKIVRIIGAQTWRPGLHQIILGNSSVQVSATDAVRIQLSSVGFFSNFEAVIYDPSHKLGLIEAPERNLTLPAFRNLFGPFSIGYCTKLSGAYYFCEFG